MHMNMVFVTSEKFEAKNIHIFSFTDFAVILLTYSVWFSIYRLSVYTTVRKIRTANSPLWKRLLIIKWVNEMIKAYSGQWLGSSRLVIISACFSYDLLSCQTILTKLKLTNENVRRGQLLLIEVNFEEILYVRKGLFYLCVFIVNETINYSLSSGKSYSKITLSECPW